MSCHRGPQQKARTGVRLGRYAGSKVTFKDGVAYLIASFYSPDFRDFSPSCFLSKQGFCDGDVEVRGAT